MSKKIDYLTEDSPIAGQLWFCVSFLSPEGIKNCSTRGLKVRGVYGTRPEAEARAKALQENDPDFHVFVGEIGKWLPWDPDPNSVEDSVYKEQELQDLMKGHKENQEKSRIMQQQRKDDMLRQAAQDEKAKESKTKTRLRKKLEARRQKEELEKSELPALDKEKQVQALDEVIRTEDDALEAESKQAEPRTTSAQTIESKLARVKELYNKMNAK
jgi:hypothetical protein